MNSLEKEQYRKVNFGIQKFEILGGNIAYLKFNKFQQLDDVQEVLMGAVQMMSNADGVILDLRNNGGGDGRTKEFLTFYFTFQMHEHAYDINIDLDGGITI